MNRRAFLATTAAAAAREHKSGLCGDRSAIRPDRRANNGINRPCRLDRFPAPAIRMLAWSR